jgi:hypothetical protein
MRQAGGRARLTGQSTSRNDTGSPQSPAQVSAATLEGVALPLAATDVDNGTILIVVALVALPIAAFAFATVGSALRSLGKGRFAIEQEMPPRRTLSAPTRVDRKVQQAEVRQMLEAKSYRREQRGQAPLDVEAEMERLLEPAEAAPPSGIDRELREEVRQLVIARNERRMRQGKPPLDVRAEVDRQLADLENLGQ